MITVHHNNDVLPRHLVGVVDVWVDVAEQDMVQIRALPVELGWLANSVANVSYTVACMLAFQ